jgi:hypothetical protein
MARVVPTPSTRTEPPTSAPEASGAEDHARGSKEKEGRVPRAGAPRPGGGPPFRSGPPRPPPTNEEVLALARRERVPNRIAKGELEGKMKCRIWKKLHAEEATRFDQAWTLVEGNPGLDLADAFGAVQSGLGVEDFRARRARVKKKEEVKEARAAISATDIDDFVAELVRTGSELALVMAERTVMDSITGVQPVAFDLQRSGPLPKLNLVLMARRATWERLAPALEREPDLTQKPATVSRQPSKRPVSDPRPFASAVGKTVRVLLRNGIVLSAPLLTLGPFDLLLGQKADEVFVPLHAIVSWSQG